MFKFGFSSHESEHREPSQDLEDTYISPEKPCCKIPLTEESIDCHSIKSIDYGEYCIKYIPGKALIEDLNTRTSESGNVIKSDGNILIEAEKYHSDLITGVYEGGLKIWECTYDLLDFIHNKNLCFSDTNVLDLGCGAGLIGIYSALKGAKVVFQDYNSEVITSITIPNVILNKIDKSKTSFYSGDWDAFLTRIKEEIPHEDQKFDFIFTSETIYNTKNYYKILNIFQNLLKERGKIYLGAKCHYFGVGGGIGDFEENLRKTNVFDYNICWQSSTGIKRAIMEISYGANL